MRRTIAKWFEARRLRKAVREAKPVAIADLDEATLGRIEGKVDALENDLEAPLTGRRCVYYSYSILEDVGPYARAGAIVTLHRETHSVPFLLENAGHRAVVDPEGATVSARVDFEVVTLSSGPLDPRLATALARLDYDVSMMRPLIFLEGVLEI